uniref:Vitronectin b n=1 Tax=Fundulus heteroclitus TaxID=8078 RepID=A0A3Q2R0B7_FUNHE
VGVLFLFCFILSSCAGRCGSFSPQKKCQCDSMCVYYGSCCEDFNTICPKKVSRGDAFDEAEEMTDMETDPNGNTVAPTVPSSLTPPPNTTHGSSPTADPNAAPCSGRPFDAFLQLKNGSIYAFRVLCLFFSGDKYYQYEFKHQPSHEECVFMSRTSPSILFTRYTDLFCDQPLENLFTDLFGNICKTQIDAKLTVRDWQGFSPPVDAAMVGKVSLSPNPTLPSPPVRQRSRGRRKRPSRRRGPQRRRQSRYVFDGTWLFDDLFDFGQDYGDIPEVATVQEYQSVPVQNVYFFKKDKYYRVSLRTKRVDRVSPPYPRSIAKYWLGCEHEVPTDPSRAEKK